MEMENSWLSDLGIETNYADQSIAITVSSQIESLKSILLEEDGYINSNGFSGPQVHGDVGLTNYTHQQIHCFGGENVSVHNASNTLLECSNAGNDDDDNLVKTKRHKEYIMAERNRRQKINEKLIALSSLVPGIKKLNKESVLSETIKYVKHLEEKLSAFKQEQPGVTPLQFQTKCYEEKKRGDPEIKVRLNQNKFWVGIDCTAKKGLLLKCLIQLENLELSVENASAFSFAEETLYLTFTGQVEMKRERNVAIADIPESLQEVFTQKEGIETSIL